jgi:hypothetical protein
VRGTGAQGQGSGENEDVCTQTDHIPEYAAARLLKAADGGSPFFLCGRTDAQHRESA